MLCKLCAYEWLPPYASVKSLSPIKTIAAAANSLQSCLTLRDPTDCSQPGSSVHGIPQAGVLEWVAIAFSLKQSRQVKTKLNRKQ